jgi:hypothetical protein
MPFHRRIRLPISTRHAYALAFDLAVRRDVWSSLLVPLALRAPWILALAVLPKPSESDRPGLALLLYAVAAVGDFVMLVVIAAMLRFRARSVFNTPVEVRPAPVTECYAQGLGRVPWLIVTEIVRNLAIVFATFFLVLPGIFLGFRLSFATESVVLHEGSTAAAFRHSFRLTPGRFERWLEMIAVSVVLVLLTMLLPAVALWWMRDSGLGVWSALPYLLGTAIAPIIQYAWTFFYLRLVEIDAPLPLAEPGPFYAAEPTVPPTPPVPPPPAAFVAPPAAPPVPAREDAPASAPHA